MNKAIKILLITLGSILLACFLFIMGALYLLEWKVTNIAELENDNTGYVVELQELGTAMFFGHSKVKVNLVDPDGHVVDSVKDYIANDGCTLTNDNIDVEWQEECVIVILNGEEQPDKSYTLTYKP